MQEVFEKIIEKLEKKVETAKRIMVPEIQDELDRIANETAESFIEAYKESIEIVKKVAAEYNDGWIPADKPPKHDNYVLLSFENFDLPLVGRFEANGEGGGTYYLGDCDEEDTCIANDLFVNAWKPLPPRYNPDREKKEKKTKYDQIRSMTVEELAEFLCKVKADYQWLEHEFPSEEDCGIWEEWLQSEVESEKND